MNTRRAFVLGLLAGVLLTLVVTAIADRSPPSATNQFADCLLWNKNGNPDLVKLGCAEKYGGR